MKGERQSERHKVNTSLTEIGDEGGKAIGEALKVNTSLTEIFLQ